MYLLSLMVFLWLGMTLTLRGGQFHNALVHRAAVTFLRAGLEVFPEQGMALGQGRVAYLDLLVRSGRRLLACEIETTARHVWTTMVKAENLGLPLWIVVPNRKVRAAVRCRRKQFPGRPGNRPIQILLLSELPQALRDYFPLIFPANSTAENGKTIPAGGRTPRVGSAHSVSDRHNGSGQPEEPPPPHAREEYSNNPDLGGPPKGGHPWKSNGQT